VLLKLMRRAALHVAGLVSELSGRGLKVDHRSMWEFVHAEKLSYKKKTLPASEQSGNIGNSALI
jgi:putative transposase